MSLRTGGSAPAIVTFSGTVRLVTWNIQFGVRAEAAAVELGHHDDLRDSDIVLLQEMDEAGTALIAERVGLHYVFAAGSIHPKSGREFGNAVLSPWPLIDATVVDLPHKSSVQGQPRIVVRATVTVGPYVIDACSVHTEVPSLSGPKRLAQFATIASATENWKADRLVIGGDFNTVTRRGIAAVCEQMATIGVVRSSSGAGTTLRRAGREFTLDHVFARGLTALDSGVVRGLEASDHRPLWVRLRPT
jgi:endonuclease/exonuclease/phosphatase family metal-dependent hydrolase